LNLFKTFQGEKCLWQFAKVLYSTFK